MLQLMESRIFCTLLAPLTASYVLLLCAERSEGQCPGTTSIIGSSPTKRYEYEDGPFHILLTASPVRCAARVVKWQAYLHHRTGNSCDLRGEIWRPNRAIPGLSASYTRVYQTEDFARKNLASLSPQTPAVVQAGDIIGVFTDGSSRRLCLSFDYPGSQEVCVLEDDQRDVTTVTCTQANQFNIILSLNVTLVHIPPTTAAPTTQSTTAARTSPTSPVTTTMVVTSSTPALAVTSPPVTEKSSPFQTLPPPSPPSSSTTSKITAARTRSIVETRTATTAVVYTTISSSTSSSNFSGSRSAMMTNLRGDITMTTEGSSSKATQGAVASSSSSSPVSLIVGLSVVFVALLIIIIIVVIRRRHQQYNMAIPPHSSDAATGTGPGSSHYDNCTMNSTLAHRGLNGSATTSVNGTLSGRSLVYDDTAYPSTYQPEKYETIERCHASVWNDNTAVGYTPVTAKPNNTLRATLKSTASAASLKYQPQCSEYLLPGQAVEGLDGTLNRSLRTSPLNVSPNRSPRISPLPAASTEIFDDMAYASPSELNAERKRAVKPKPRQKKKPEAVSNVYDLPDSKQGTLKTLTRGIDAPAPQYHTLETPGTSDLTINSHGYHTLEAQPNGRNAHAGEYHTLEAQPSAGDACTAYHVADVQSDTKAENIYSNSELLRKNTNQTPQELHYDNLSFDGNDTMSRGHEEVYYSNAS